MHKYHKGLDRGYRVIGGQDRIVEILFYCISLSESVSETNTWFSSQQKPTFELGNNAATYQRATSQFFIRSSTKRLIEDHLDRRTVSHSPDFAWVYSTRHEAGYYMTTLPRFTYILERCLE